MLTSDQRSEASHHEESEYYPGRCRMCGKKWPCITAALLEEVADLEAALAVETEGYPDKGLDSEANAALNRLLTRIGPLPALGAPYDSDAKAEQP